MIYLKKPIVFSVIMRDVRGGTNADGALKNVEDEYIFW